MAAEIGIIAGVVGIASATYSTCKSLYQFLTGIHNAPRDFELLMAELNEVMRVLDNFQKLEKEHEGSDSFRQIDAFKASLEQVKPCFNELSKACEAFREKLENAWKHSTAGHTSKRDRLKFPFQDKAITSFQHRLASYKETINVALSLANLGSTSDLSRDLQNLEETVEFTSVTLAGQIRGIEISMQTLAESGSIALSADNDRVLRAMEEQKVIFQKCLDFCISTSTLARKTSPGTLIKLAKVEGYAKQFVGQMGNVEDGGPTLQIDELLATGNSRQLGGRVDGATGLEFLK